MEVDPPKLVVQTPTVVEPTPDAEADRPLKRQKLESSDVPEAKPKFFIPSDSAVGITEYIDATVPSFTGIIKHRFTDFLVNEVDQTGEVVRLRDLKGPKPETKSVPTEAPTPPNKSTSEKQTDSNSWPESAEATLTTFLPAEKIVELKEFIERGPPKWGAETPAPRRFATGTMSDKALRGQYHQAIRELFKGRLATAMTSVDDEPVIEAFWGKGRKDTDRRRSKDKDTTQEQYIEFHLQKTNRETHDALNALANAFKCNSKELTVAGTKDKRAVTVQRVSLRRGKWSLGDVWRAVNGRSFNKFGPPMLRGIQIGDLRYAQAPIQLGDLMGNHFVITLRDVQADTPDTIARAVQTVRDRGFINYYGMQRFGGTAIGTHEIGLALQQSDWARASQLILAVREGESDEVTTARQVYADTKNWAKANAMLPNYLVAEKTLLRSYAKSGDEQNKAAAIAQIPKNLRMMYVHAYQSRLWNRVCSERIKRFGSERPVVGDLVYAEDAKEPTVELDVDAAEALDQLAEASTTAAESTSEVKAEAELDTQVETDGKTKAPNADLIESLRKASSIPRVKVLTEADLADYTIFDVVLPLPGFLVTYPGGALGQLYRDLMIADGLDPDNLYRRQKEFSMSGTYRKLLHRPSRFDYRTLHYSDPAVTLAQTDEEVARQKKLPASDGQYTALQIEMTLGSSCYATMALREILKTDTGSGAQRVLTEAMEARTSGETNGTDELTTKVA